MWLECVSSMDCEVVNYWLGDLGVVAELRVVMFR
jgi:hypothetical protein